MEPVSLLGSDEIGRILRRMAVEIAERTRGGPSLAIVGVRRGGVPVARRLAALLREAERWEVPVGSLDIALYRDDAATALPDPKIGPSEIRFDVSGRDVVICDDVLQSGRTVRAAIDALMDYGRPRRIWLAVLIDRGGRELPIAADFVGRVLDVPLDARLDARLDEPGESDALWQVSRRAPRTSEPYLGPPPREEPAS